MEEKEKEKEGEEEGAEGVEDDVLRVVFKRVL